MSPDWGGVLTPLTARARGWQLPASWARARASRSWHSCWHARQTPTATCSHPPTSAGALWALPASRASQRPSPDGVPGAPSPILGSPRSALCDPGPPPCTSWGALEAGLLGASGVASPPGKGGPRGSRQTDRQGEGPACHLAPLQRDDGGQRRARR